MEHVLVTGANRGIGLELTRQLLARGEKVFASCRQPALAETLRGLASRHGNQLTIVPLDVSDDASIESAAEVVEQHTDHLDLLFNNAGVRLGHESLGRLEREVLLETYNINAVGPLLVAERFASLVAAGDRPRMLNISSQLGSLQRKSSGGGYGYDSSKAALNMLTRALAFDLQSQGVIVVAVHPGWVRTDMGGTHAAISVEASAAGLIQLADQLNMEKSAGFFTWEGARTSMVGVDMLL